MLHDLANYGGYVALKRAAEDRRMETQRKDVKNLLCSRRLLMTAALAEVYSLLSAILIISTKFVVLMTEHVCMLL